MKKILYFTWGQPTEADRQKAIEAGAVFRDAQAWHEGDFVEQCDCVMGDAAIIPKPYLPFIVKQEEEPKVQPLKKQTRKAKKRCR